MSNCIAVLVLLPSLFLGPVIAQSASRPAEPMAGFVDYSRQLELDKKFLAVPEAAAAGQDLKALTATPHIAGSKEDYATAEFVAAKFRRAGLETKITPYRVLMNMPAQVQVTAYAADGKLLMHGPSPEHVSDDPYQDDKRIVTAFHAYSPSGDVTADAVYANYGRPQDFAELASRHISVRGKIVVMRYGKNFRGVKVYVAQQHGAAGVILYSDPADDGYYKGDKYPAGPWRPDSGVQRGSVQYLFKFPGDPTTPGFASTANLPEARRMPLQNAANQPTIPSTPLSYQDAAPILQALGGPDTPRSWQGALPFTYHIGPGPVKVHLLLRQDYRLRTIWDVTGRVSGTTYPNEWVVVGNHRDAWVFGAVDPNSGTASMLEAVHGVGALLRQGWKPQRTLIFASWDAEEEGLIGSTEWAEQHADQLANAAAYFNIDVGVSGPNFEASAVPSLKPFVVELTRLVPSAAGGTVYTAWKASQQHAAMEQQHKESALALQPGRIHMDDLGSGSDYTPFLQHLGVPSTDIGSNGPYGVYHSAFDNYAWFTKFADPNFVYLQQQARMLGLEAITMADADLLPYDYAAYGRAVEGYLGAARTKAFAHGMQALNFDAALQAAQDFRDAGAKAFERQQHPEGDLARENQLLRQTEEDLLSASGLPNRPWYKHTIYAPGEYTGYAAVVIPGVNEAIEAGNAARASDQLTALTNALERAAATLRQVVAVSQSGTAGPGTVLSPSRS